MQAQVASREQNYRLSLTSNWLFFHFNKKRGEY